MDQGREGRCPHLVQGIGLVCVLLPAALGSHSVLLLLLQLLLMLLRVLKGTGTGILSGAGALCPVPFLCPVPKGPFLLESLSGSLSPHITWLERQSHTSAHSSCCGKMSRELGAWDSNPGRAAFMPTTPLASCVALASHSLLCPAPSSTPGGTGAFLTGHRAAAQGQGLIKVRG